MTLLRYRSDEEILKGDRVLFHGEPGQIEFVVSEAVGNPELDSSMNEHGGGVMIMDGVAGRTFMTTDQIPDCEDLEFLSRRDAP